MYIKTGHLACIMLIASVGLSVWIGTINGSMWEKAFSTVKIGDSREEVVRKLGKPRVIDTENAPYFRYAYRRCEAPCAERLWYEPYLIFFHGLWGWSVSLDINGNVIDKYYYVSP